MKIRTDVSVNMSMKAAPLSILLFVQLVSWTAHARPTLSPERMKQLKQGEVLTFAKKVEGSNVMAGKAIAIIEDVPEAVTYVIMAMDKYKHFLPRVTDSRIVKRRGWHVYAVVHTDLPWPFKDCWAYTKMTRRDKTGRVFELKWHMLNGTMKSYTGAALIEPWNKEGTRSVLTYQLLPEPKTSAPDSLLSKGMQDVVRTIVKRFRLRLKALRKFNKMPKGL